MSTQTPSKPQMSQPVTSMTPNPQSLSQMNYTMLLKH